MINKGFHEGLKFGGNSPKKGNTISIENTPRRRETPDSPSNKKNKFIKQLEHMRQNYMGIIDGKLTEEQ